VHTHSLYATAWAQARREIPCLGTTHADYFYGAVAVTEPLDPERIEGAYEENTGRAIIERIGGRDPMETPAVLAASHGPFIWGATATVAAHNAVILEEIARTAFVTLTINAGASPISQALLDKHFLRKHGPGASYGQK